MKQLFPVPPKMETVRIDAAVYEKLYLFHKTAILWRPTSSEGCAREMSHPRELVDVGGVGNLSLDGEITQSPLRPGP